MTADGRTPDEPSLVETDFMARHGIEPHLDDPAETIDRATRTVTSRAGPTVRASAHRR
ncbi:hypothetical protein OG292_28760 [Streptomyces sp. NBC_01511]|uniref:hypothetical protein n=1 Tax=Streptomyces sp. NBC_01511 TaxID=2903889 RepID=UPI00386DD32D